MINQHALVEMAADIAAAYVSAHDLAADKVPDLIRAIYAALETAANGKPAAAPLEPAVPIKKSITYEAIICLEDGKPFRSLKRHLRTKYNLTPEQYRAKWGLPADYPMVAPAYAAARSKLAKAMGLGSRRNGQAAAANGANGANGGGKVVKTTKLPKLPKPQKSIKPRKPEPADGEDA